MTRPCRSRWKMCVVTWPEPPNVAWSTQVYQADWIAERLRPPDDFSVGSIVPKGFSAYARILHPALGPHNLPVRWRTVASWSGRTLLPQSEFDTVAIPESKPEEPLPWRQGPRNGTLDPDDLRALLAILERHTDTPEQCWFCIWAGYGWSRGSSAVLARSGSGPLPDPQPHPDPVPRHVREGPLVDLPWREYFLYTGPIGDAVAFVPTESQSPNLFWPSDRSWCVASEIDLPWTYVGGSAAMVEEVLASGDIEAQPTDTLVRHGHVEPWIGELAESAVNTLIETGKCTIETTVGTVWASLERSGLVRGNLELVTRYSAETGTRGGSRSPLGRHPATEARYEIVWRLTAAIAGLVE